MRFFAELCYYWIRHLCSTARHGEVLAIYHVSRSFIRYVELILDPTVEFVVGCNIMLGSYLSAPTETNDTTTILIHCSADKYHVL